MALKPLGHPGLKLDEGSLLLSHTEASSLTEQAHQDLLSRFDSQEIGFFHAPVQSEIHGLEATLELAQKLRQSSLEDVLFLGIGGSALGPICLLSALAHRSTPRFRFHFHENPDPIDWKLRIESLDPSKTLVIAVTKSGSTFETISTFLIALDWLGKSRWSEQVVAITDPQKGDLREFASRHHLSSLPVHPSLGGRFSVFSPVGLFAAALQGLDTRAFLQGAAQIRQSVIEQKSAHPLWQLSSRLLEIAPTHPTHVCMPYSSRLRLTADWWVQLWGESLGKEGKGFAPLASVGATDQHSLLQLLRDGPNDKVTFFIRVADFPDTVSIPSLGSATEGLPAFERLEGHSLGQLLSIEQRAIQKVFCGNQRPCVCFEIQQLDESHFGALLFSFAFLTAATGTLWSVDPFDQPGVEEGKIYIAEALQQNQ